MLNQFELLVGLLLLSFLRARSWPRVIRRHTNLAQQNQQNTWAISGKNFFTLSRTDEEPLKVGIFPLGGFSIMQNVM